MKPQIFTNKLKAKGFRRNATGIWIHPNYAIGFKPIANYVTIWHKRQGFDGQIIMTEAVPHKLKSMDDIYTMVKEIDVIPKTTVDNNISNISNIRMRPDFKNDNVLKDVSTSNHESFKESPMPTTTIPPDENKDTYERNESDWSWGDNSGSPIIKEKTFLQKYKWFIIGGIIILFLISNNNN